MSNTMTNITGTIPVRKQKLTCVIYRLVDLSSIDIFVHVWCLLNGRSFVVSIVKRKSFCGNPVYDTKETYLFDSSLYGEIFSYSGLLGSFTHTQEHENLNPIDLAKIAIQRFVDKTDIKIGDEQKVNFVVLI